MRQEWESAFISTCTEPHALGPRDRLTIWITLCLPAARVKATSPSGWPNLPIRLGQPSRPSPVVNGNRWGGLTKGSSGDIDRHARLVSKDLCRVVDLSDITQDAGPEPYSAIGIMVLTEGNLVVGA